MFTAFQTDLFMANNLLHMSAEHFASSERFVPERWLRNDAQFGAEFKSRNPFVYLPLGFGPRMCIGKRFAEMELQILTTRWAIVRMYVRKLISSLFFLSSQNVARVSLGMAPRADEILEFDCYCTRR